MILQRGIKGFLARKKRSILMQQEVKSSRTLPKQTPFMFKI